MKLTKEELTLIENYRASDKLFKKILRDRAQTFAEATSRRQQGGGIPCQS